MQTSASLGIESWPIVLQFYKKCGKTIKGDVKRSNTRETKISPSRFNLNSKEEFFILNSPERTSSIEIICIGNRWRNISHHLNSLKTEIPLDLCIDKS